MKIVLKIMLFSALGILFVFALIFAKTCPDPWAVSITLYIAAAIAATALFTANQMYISEHCKPGRESENPWKK